MSEIAIPVSKIRRSRSTPKGRPVDPVARADVARVLEGASLARDHLIENLHRVQDRFGSLSAAHLNALAEAMKLSQAEVYEVASFYHHFDLVKEGDAAPAQTTVRVCETLSCRMAGAEELIAKLPSIVGTEVRVLRAPCIGRCGEAPAVCVGHNAFGNADADSVKAALDAKQTRAPALSPITYAEYRAQGGYETWLECVSGRRELDAVIKTMEDSALRGPGSARTIFHLRPTGKPAPPRPRSAESSIVLITASSSRRPETHSSQVSYPPCARYSA